MYIEMTEEPQKPEPPVPELPPIPNAMVDDDAERVELTSQPQQQQRDVPSWDRDDSRPTDRRRDGPSGGRRSEHSSRSGSRKTIADVSLPKTVVKHLTHSKVRVFESRALTSGERKYRGVVTL